MIMHNDFGNAVNEYFVKEFRRLYKERQHRIDALTTPGAVLEYAAQKGSVRFLTLTVSKGPL